MYILTWESQDYHGDGYKYYWEEQRARCETYEELIREYAEMIHAATSYPNKYRNVRAWKLEPMELLPDTPELNEELNRLHEKEQREKEERLAKAQLEARAKAADEKRLYETLKKKYEGDK